MRRRRRRRATRVLCVFSPMSLVRLLRPIAHPNFFKNTPLTACHPLWHHYAILEDSSVPWWVCVQGDTTERHASESGRSGYLHLCGAEIREAHREANRLADRVASDGLVERHLSFFRCLRAMSCMDEDKVPAKVSDLPEVETPVFTRREIVKHIADYLARRKSKQPTSAQNEVEAASPT